MSPETGLKIFLQAQVVVSDYLGTKCFNTAIHAVCAIVTCTKHKLKQQSSKQAEDFKEDQFLKTVSYFSATQVFLMLSCQSLEQKIYMYHHIKRFFAKQHSNCDFFLRNHFIVTFVIDSVTKFGQGVIKDPCVIYFIISFHEWNLVYLCHSVCFKLFV